MSNGGMLPLHHLNCKLQIYFLALHLSKKIPDLVGQYLTAQFRYSIVQYSTIDYTHILRTFSV